MITPNQVKLVDFGFGAQFISRDKGGFLKTLIGTQSYVLPEPYLGQPYYGADHDLFSLGVLLFICHLRSYPFERATLDDKFYKLLVKNDPKFWQLKSNGMQISSKFKDLVSNMLQFRPAARLNIAEIICHDWFNRETVTDEEYKQKV